MVHMIPVSDSAWQTPVWQKELADAVTDPAELLALLGLDATLVEDARIGARLFRMKVPRAFIARMRRGDRRDPLLRQVLPLAAEAMQVPGFTNDPLAETGTDLSDGLLQKYAGRALVVTTGACAIHCRYCFRRHFPYGESRAATEGWRGVLDRFAADASLVEAILSGGDPLALADSRLAALVRGLESVPHLKRLRLHTRLPVVLPSRVDEHLTRWLGRTRLEKVVVLHVNHPAEIDDAVRNAVRALAGTGATLLNQSVLLEGINDDACTLAELSEALHSAGVLPYYLHLLDPVVGAAHFEVPIQRATALHSALRARLPGYLVPRLVREHPGEPAKTFIA